MLGFWTLLLEKKEAEIRIFPDCFQISGQTLHLRTAGLIMLAGLYNSVQVVIDFNQCRHPSAPFSCPPQTGQMALACTILKRAFS